MTGTSTRTSACCSSSPSASRAAVAAVGVSGAREASLQSILSESASCALASTAAAHAPVLTRRRCYLMLLHHQYQPDAPGPYVCWQTRGLCTIASAGGVCSPLLVRCDAR